MGLFDLDENLNQGSNAYEKELRKAKLHVLREEFDKAEAIYNAILEEDMEVLGAYIGLVRVYSKDFTILEGELIDKNVRIIDKIFDDIDDEDYIDFIARRKKAKRKAEEEAAAKEEEAKEKAEREKKAKQEAEKLKNCIHINLLGHWEDLPLDSNDGNNFFLKGLELEKGVYFKVNLNGDWRGHENLKLSLSADNDFSSDLTPERNILVKRKGVYDLYVSKAKDGAGEYKGKSIWIELSDTSLRKSHEDELLKAAEERKKAEAEKKRKDEEKKRQEAEKRRKEAEERKKAEAEKAKKEAQKAREVMKLHVQDGEFFDPNITELPPAVIDRYKDAEVLVIPPKVKMYWGMLKNFKRLRKLTCPKTKGVTLANLFPYDSARRLFEIPRTLSEVRIEGGDSELEYFEFISTSDEKGRYSPIEKLVLGNGIEKIASLQLMDNLKEFSIPPKIREIPDGTFFGCTALPSITIPKSVTQIGWRAFAGCSSLKKVLFEERVTGLYIDLGVFADCPALREIAIPAKASVKGSLFSGCTLEKVSCSVALMPSGPFGGDNSIKELVLEYDGIHGTIDSNLLPIIPIDTLVFKEGFTDLGFGAFTSFQNIRHIKFPSSLRRMGRLAFNGCKVLEEVEMPGRMDSIPEDAFYSCSSLKEVTIPEGITTLSNCIFQCTALSVLRLPSTLRECRTGVRATGSNHLTVKYPGTMAQWKAIKGGEYFSLYKGCSVECSDGTIVGQYD